jgi:hypothetical protein
VADLQYWCARLAKNKNIDKSKTANVYDKLKDLSGIPSSLQSKVLAEVALEVRDKQAMTTLGTDVVLSHLTNERKHSKYDAAMMAIRYEVPLAIRKNEAIDAYREAIAQKKYLVGYSFAEKLIADDCYLQNSLTLILEKNIKKDSYHYASYMLGRLKPPAHIKTSAGVNILANAIVDSKGKEALDRIIEIFGLAKENVVDAIFAAQKTATFRTLDGVLKRISEEFSHIVSVKDGPGQAPE